MEKSNDIINELMSFNCGYVENKIYDGCLTVKEARVILEGLAVRYYALSSDDRCWDAIKKRTGEIKEDNVIQFKTKGK